MNLNNNWIAVNQRLKCELCEGFCSKYNNLVRHLYWHCHMLTSTSPTASSDSSSDDSSDSISSLNLHPTEIQVEISISDVVSYDDSKDVQ